MCWILILDTFIHNIFIYIDIYPQIYRVVILYWFSGYLLQKWIKKENCYCGISLPAYRLSNIYYFDSLIILNLIHIPTYRYIQLFYAFSHFYSFNIIDKTVYGYVYLCLYVCIFIHLQFFCCMCIVTHECLNAYKRTHTFSQ